MLPNSRPSSGAGVKAQRGPDSDRPFHRGNAPVSSFPTPHSAFPLIHRWPFLNFGFWPKYVTMPCNEEANFTPSQRNLIASPDGNRYLDWQVKPGQKLYYRLTQVTLDGLESPASNEVSAEVK